MTSGRQGRNPGPGHVGPVGGTTRLRRSGPAMGRGSFTDRVMARVAEEPTPSPGRVFARSLRRFAIRDALGALVAAWRLAFEPASPVATSARASAAALFLSVIIVVGVGGAFVTGGALSLLGPDGAAPQDLAPAAAPTESPAVTIEPTPSPSPTAIATPSPSPTPIATPSATERAPTDPGDRTERETPEPEERKQEKKEKRETPEPKERERDERDEKDERDERDEEDERQEDD
mgnify:CR=1 FL=1